MIFPLFAMLMAELNIAGLRRLRCLPQAAADGHFADTPTLAIMLHFADIIDMMIRYAITRFSLHVYYINASIFAR